jgi:Flp pilus assembly pilin Flp
MREWLRNLRDREEGATALEYAIIASFIAAACAVAVGVFGNAVVTLFSVHP